MYIPVAHAQLDTSAIKEVELSEIFISENREQYYNKDRSQQKLDESTLNLHGHYDISEVLSTVSMANITSYGGMGGSASISIRGTNADHTVVMWNGFNINSLTLGESDLSLVSVEAADQATILYSGASTLLGSGSFGGGLLLENKPDWNNKFKLNYRLKTGSFKYQGHHLKFVVGNKKVQYSMKLFYQNATNNFGFTDKYKLGEPQATQTHNALTSYGTVQNLFLKAKKAHFFEFGLWTQRKTKEIPPTMGRYGESNKLQNDFNFRFYGQWRKVFTKGRLQAKSAYMQDYLHYTDKADSTDDFFLIDSKIETKRVLNKINYRHIFNNYLQGEIGGEANVLIGDVSSYGGIIKETLGSIYMDLKPNYKSTSANVSIRQEIDKNTAYIRPLFSVGLQQRLFNKRFSVSFSYADKYRKPDFNERYWIPGGNINLIPEIGWGIDAGVNINLINETDKQALTLSTTYYRTIINNGIVWKPAGEGFWSPENIERVKTQGLENQLQYKYLFRKNTYSTFDFRYHFNKAVNAYTGTQLAYRPKHIVKGNVSLNHKHFLANLSWSYNSQRFTDDSENKIFELAAYHLVNLSISGKYTADMLDLVVGFEIKNLTNTAYEVARTFAQPGRAYYLNLSISFNKSILNTKNKTQ